MKFILELMRKWLPSILQILVGKVNPKVPGKIKQKLKRNQKEYLIYLVSIRYNQKNYDYDKVDRYSKRRGVGLATYVKEAIRIVKDEPGLIPDKKIYRKFIRQPAAKCAKALCSSVIRYIWLEMVGVDLPSFTEWYIKSVARGYITYATEGYCWVKNDRPMISDFMSGSKYWQKSHNVNFTNVTAMVRGFLNRKEKIGLVRKGTKNRNTHTYLVSKFNNEVIMFDTWHSHYTGRNILMRHPKPDALWWIYGY